MRTASLVLVVLGGLLSLGPLVWLWVAGSRRKAELHAERDVIAAATEAGTQPALPAGRFMTWGDLTPLKQDIELAILDNATTAARLPLALVVVGIIASTAGGVLGLYV